MSEKQTAGVVGRFSDPARMVLHLTDLSPESELAFAHALRIAVQNQGYLTVMHVDSSKGTSSWDDFPTIRTTLQRWGMLEAGANRSDVAKLGINVEKLVDYDRSVLEAVDAFMRERPVDLIVVATQGREGLPRWLKPSTAERVAAHTEVPTLFVPAAGRGCVSPQDGQVTMNQVLVPVDHQPRPESAVERGLRTIDAFGHEQSQLTLLHVGPETRFPTVSMPDGPWRLTRTTRHGNPVSEILAAAEECLADLIIMVTEGKQGVLDVLRGTTTEQVLRRCPCPLLAVPAGF